ncbi:MAG: HAMP domain-containing histidine kinase [Alphaproteobacteria bacterium]|nr:HAMP domain-containing histidine kinase [Alphaproteobacteria bacterium]
MPRLRRHGTVAATASLVIVAFAALAAIGGIDRLDQRLRTQQAVSEAAAQALAREQRALDRLAALASEADPSGRLLDQISTLVPEIRAVAIFDDAGHLLNRAGDIGAAVLESIADGAARQAAEAPRWPFALPPVTPAGGTADERLTGLAAPWRDAHGDGGFVLIAATGTALGAAAGPPHGPMAVPLLQGAWPFVALAVIGISALLTLLTLLTARLQAVEQRFARHAERERELRDRFSKMSAAAQRDEELSRARTRFFAQVAHELRTPLNAILGFAETFRHQLFGPLANPRYREYAELIYDAGSHLLSLINDLLDNSRIEAGKMQIAPMRVSAAALGHAALDLVRLIAEGRRIAVAATGLGACPDLQVDPRAMKQVLVNLLSNAIKYTPPGGRVELTFAARGDGGVSITVADTGIGMSAEDLRVAFEPFGRAAAAEAQQQGTGLGLSLARSLVRLHGGELTLSSRVASGTVASIALPASAVVSDGRPAAPANPTDAAAA